MADLKSRDHKDGAAVNQRLLDTFAEFGPRYGQWLRANLPSTEGLTLPRMKVLEHLHVSGPQIMSRLRARMSDLGSRTMTLLVDGLEREGLVERGAAPKDRRAFLIKLTARGEAVVLGFREPHRAAAASLFDVLSEPERRSLLDLTGRLLQALAERRVGEATGKTDAPAHRSED